MLRLVQKLLLLTGMLGCSSLGALKLDRVILASDANPAYLEFWPLVAKTWTAVTGLRPTLALVADENVTVDESLGDVIRFPPIPGVSTALQAQVIRLFLPALFPDDGCLISDIDMLPLQKTYFVQSVAAVADHKLVVYRNSIAAGERLNMCYVAAKGRVFAELFDVSAVDRTAQLMQIRDLLTKVAALNWGWNTDELYLTQAVNSWPARLTRCVMLGHPNTGRIDRCSLHYNSLLQQQVLDFKSLELAARQYIDAHLPRPYHQYRFAIDEVVRWLQQPPQYYCTAADSKFYEKVLQLVQGINQHNGDQVAKILVFDLGFTKEQQQTLAQLPKVWVRQLKQPHPAVLKMFQTAKNRFVRGWFMWKPLVIQQALDECPYIFYIDSAIEVYGPLTDLFRHIIHQGYFLVASDQVPLKARMTKYVRQQLVNQLGPEQRQLCLAPTTFPISAGIQGLSRAYYERYLLPVAKLAREPQFFADDGSAKLGFGAGRHDQTLFSIYAYLNQMVIQPHGWMNLAVGDGEQVKFHAHWNRKELHERSALKY